MANRNRTKSARKPTNLAKGNNAHGTNNVTKKPAVDGEKKKHADGNERKKSVVSRDKKPTVADKSTPVTVNAVQKPAVVSKNKPTAKVDGKKPAVEHAAKKPAAAKTKKPPIGFLDLPGEIRNIIYTYCFEDEVWIDMTPNANHILKQSNMQPGTWTSDALYNFPKSTAEGNNASPTAVATAQNTTAFPHLNITDRRTAIFSANTTATGDVPKPSRHKPHRIAYKPHPRRPHSGPDNSRNKNSNNKKKNNKNSPGPTKWATSVGALVLTCRQVHAEALPFFYATPFFIFSAPGPLRRWLALLPPHKLTLVRKLHVAHATYGSPMNPDDERWRERHERAWAAAMADAARLLVGLRLLRCRVVANERPLVFAMGSPTVVPASSSESSSSSSSSASSTAIVATTPAWAVGLIDAWEEACRRRLLGSVEAEQEAAVMVAGEAGSLGPLRVELALQSAWVVRNAYMPEEALRGALVELHRLFAEAVRRRLCGWNEQDAIVEFNRVKFDKYRQLIEAYPMP